FRSMPLTALIFLVAQAVTTGPHRLVIGAVAPVLAAQVGPLKTRILGSATLLTRGSFGVFAEPDMNSVIARPLSLPCVRGFASPSPHPRSAPRCFSHRL